MTKPKQYKKPIMYTVELVCGHGSANVEWEFSPIYENNARELFKALARTPGKHPDGQRVVTVNLVAWDRHPGQDDAVGLILDQKGWDEDDF